LRTGRRLHPLIRSVGGTPDTLLSESLHDFRFTRKGNFQWLRKFNLPVTIKPMSVCTRLPELCGKKEFLLRNPMARPPDSGWRIIRLPYQAAHLQGDWNTAPGTPSSGKAAWADLMLFLQANKIKVPFEQIYDESTEQWCAEDPARCRGYRRKRSGPKLTWAKAKWEWANSLLVNTSDPKAALEQIVAELTRLINGPKGCVICAHHWVEVLDKAPIPPTVTLDEARHWLVDRHNETREGKEPTSYEEVAAKFNWLPE